MNWLNVMRLLRHGIRRKAYSTEFNIHQSFWLQTMVHLL